MDALLPILLFAALAAIVIVAAIYSAKAARQRREALAAWAASHSFSFDPEPDPGHDSEFPQFSIFSRGHSRRAFNTIRGSLSISSRPFPLKCGDYEYKVTSSNGKTTTTRTYRFSYLILTLPFAPVPNLLVRREGLFDKLTQMLGFDDIDFESEEFSRKFCVKSSDKKFAYDVITPQMMQFLLETGSGFTIDRSQTCLSDGASRWEPPQFDSQLAWAGQFFDLWPTFVLQQLESRELRP